MFIIKTVFILLAVSGLIYVGYLVIGDTIITPCSPHGIPGRCYYAPQNVCEVVWNNSEKTCKEWIKQFSFAPGRLTSPIIEKCREAEFDKVFHQSFKSSPECEERRHELEDWKRENL